MVAKTKSILDYLRAGGRGKGKGNQHNESEKESSREKDKKKGPTSDRNIKKIEDEMEEVNRMVVKVLTCLG
uniref:Uncharacterized protein n=1 Tax=Anguilla anguilla TaxID=7936 RepID=A0A0E9VKQ2_ANGAN